MATSIAASVRRYSADERAFIELSGAMGTEAVTVGAGPVFEMLDTRYVQIRARHGVWRRLHVTGALSYSGQERLPDRTGGSIGILIE